MAKLLRGFSPHPSAFSAFTFAERQRISVEPVSQRGQIIAQTAAKVRFSSDRRSHTPLGPTKPTVSPTTVYKSSLSPSHFAFIFRVQGFLTRTEFRFPATTIEGYIIYGNGNDLNRVSPLASWFDEKGGFRQASSSPQLKLLVPRIHFS
jgi:hypothetical protein